MNGSPQTPAQPRPAGCIFPQVHLAVPPTPPLSRGSQVSMPSQAEYCSLKPKQSWATGLHKALHKISGTGLTRCNRTYQGATVSSLSMVPTVLFFGIKKTKLVPTQIKPRLSLPKGPGSNHQSNRPRMGGEGFFTAGTLLLHTQHPLESSTRKGTEIKTREEIVEKHLRIFRLVMMHIWLYWGETAIISFLLYYIKLCFEDFLFNYLEASSEIPHLKEHPLTKELQEP